MHKCIADGERLAILGVRGSFSDEIVSPTFIRVRARGNMINDWEVRRDGEAA